LVTSGLIYDRYSICTNNLNLEKDLSAEEGWIKISPNERGAELFLKALGFKTLDANIITSVDVDFRMSSFIKLSFDLPKGFKWKHLPGVNPLDKLRVEFEEKIDEVKSNVDDIENTVDDIESTVNSLKVGTSKKLNLKLEDS